MTTAAILRMELASCRSDDLDEYVRRVCHDVEHRGSLLRLGHQRLDLIGGGVRVDFERHLDALEAVTHVAVDAQDALDVHRPLDGRRDGAELDLAMLGN